MANTFVEHVRAYRYSFVFEVNGDKHSILFDTGPDDDLVVDNAKRLGIDLSEVEAIIISHGHFDHYGGVVSVLDAIGKTDLPVYMHPAMFEPRAFDVGEGRKYHR